MSRLKHLQHERDPTPGALLQLQFDPTEPTRSPIAARAVQLRRRVGFLAIEYAKGNVRALKHAHWSTSTHEKEGTVLHPAKQYVASSEGHRFLSFSWGTRKAHARHTQSIRTNDYVFLMRNHCDRICMLSLLMQECLARQLPRNCRGCFYPTLKKLHETRYRNLTRIRKRRFSS